MGSCYSGDHIAEDHTHSDITTHNFEEPEQKYHLGTASNILPGWGLGGMVDVAFFTDHEHTQSNYFRCFGLTLSLPKSRRQNFRLQFFKKF